MAGDIGIREKIIVLPEAGSATAPAMALAGRGGRILHQYGKRVLLAQMPPGAEDAVAATLSPGAVGAAVAEGLTQAEALGLAAFRLRESTEFAQAKASRPRQGQRWDSADDGEPLVCTDVGIDPQEVAALATAGAGAPPLSARLTGKVAVGLIIVEGPTAALKFSETERQKVVAEVQNGLGWLGAQNPSGEVSWVYDLHVITISEKPLTGDPTPAQMEARFRDPAMAKLGYGNGLSNVTKYANDIRSKLDTNWAYVAYFTKYPLGHFAYASIGGPRLVMDYANDGWGPDNIDRVFAHETGHIFGAPDEYAASGCNCDGSWGYYNKPNSNCANCAPAGGVACLMKSNDWDMCAWTPYHLGFPLADQRYSGVWRAAGGKYALWANGSYQSFIDRWNQWGGQGLRLVDVDIVQIGRQRRYTGVWQAGVDAYGLWVNADWSSFIAKWKEWSQRNLRLVDIEVINAGGKNLYTGVFRAGSDAYGLWVNSSWSSFKSKWQEWSGNGLRLVDLKITNFGGQRRYSGVFRAGNDAYGLWINADWNSFDAKWKEWSRNGLRLVDLEVTNFDGKRRYSGVFRGGRDAYGLWVNANWTSFKAKWEEWAGKGMRLVDIEVVDPANQASSPVPQVAVAFDVELDENGGDGFGGMHGGDDVDDGGDIDVGAMAAGSEWHSPMVSLAASATYHPGESGDGGMGGEGLAAAAAVPAAYAASDGFGGLGAAVPAIAAGDDGLGGLGEITDQGADSDDLDTGSAVGV